MSTKTKTKSSSSSRRLFGVLLHPCSGKTALASSVHGKSGRKNVVFIDVDANVKYEPGQTAIDYFPKIKEKIDKAYNDYPTYKIAVISSNQKLFEFLKVNKSNVFVYVPDEFLFLHMLVDRGLLETPLEETELNGSVFSEKESESQNSKKKKGTVYSLGKEQNKTQGEVEGESLDYVDLYNREMKAIVTSRKELLSRKHKKYASLDGLISGVFNDILHQKDV